MSRLLRFIIFHAAAHHIKDACNLDHASSSQIRKAEPLLTLILKTRESTTGCTACKSETARTDAQKISALNAEMRESCLPVRWSGWWFYPQSCFKTACLPAQCERRACGLRRPVQELGLLKIRRKNRKI